jgi:isopenicillin N synthase-like dioxygenase
MARWTNDQWISTLHRVCNPPPEQMHVRRISLPFFCQPNYDAVISALPSCFDSARPPKYPPITSGENMLQKRAKTFEGVEARK